VRGDRAYALALGAVVCAVAVLAEAIAARASFVADDWQFLAFAKHRGIDVGQALLPLAERDHWGYRPLGVDLYFESLLAAFGVDVRPFIRVSFAALALRSAAVFGILRELQVARVVAAAAAVFCLTRWPGLDRAFWASTYQYVGGSAFGAVSLWLFLRHLRTGSALAQLGALVSLAAATLHTESALAWGAVLGLAALWRDPPAASRAWVGRAALRFGPLVVLAAVYGLLRFAWIAPMESPAYVTGPVGPATAARNVLATAGLVFAEAPAALGLGGLALAAAARRRWQGEGRQGALVAFGLGAAGLLVLPYVLVLAPAARFAVALEVPLTLVLAAAVADALARWSPDRRRLALALGVVVCVPWAALAGRLSDPPGALAGRAVASLRALSPPPAAGSRLLVHYGGSRTASPEAYGAIAREIWAGWLTASIFPRDVGMRFVDLREQAPPHRCPGCRYLALRPDGRLDEVDRGELLQDWNALRPRPTLRPQKR